MIKNCLNCNKEFKTFPNKITFGREMPENIKGWGHHLLEGSN